MLEENDKEEKKSMLEELNTNAILEVNIFTTLLESITDIGNVMWVGREGREIIY